MGQLINKKEKKTRIIKITIDNLYHGYKEELCLFYKKYFRHDGNPLLWKNVPISLFALDYVKLGHSLLENFDEHPFIAYEYDRYKDAESVKDDSHKFNAARRIMKMVDSVEKYGYAKGKYDKPKHLIKVKRGFESPFGSDPDGYVLLARKHRAAAAYALGLKKIRVRLLAS